MAEPVAVTITSPSSNKPAGRRGRLRLIVLAGALGADLVRFIGSMTSPDRMPTLKRWLPYAWEVGRDDRLYKDHPDYKYPPFFLILIRPLTALSPASAAAVWQLAKYASLALIFGMTWGLFDRGGGLPPWVKILSVALSVRFIASDLGHGNVDSNAMNQSLTAVTNRLLGRSELSPTEKPVALVDLATNTIVWIQRALAVAALAFLAWACRGALPRNDRLALVAEWSLVGAATLVLSGFTWTGHFCLLITGQVAVLAYLNRCRGRRPDRAVLAATLLAQGLLFLTSDIIGPAGREWCKAHGLPLLGVLGLALVLVRGRCRPGAIDEAAPDGASANGGAG